MLSLCEIHLVIENTQSTRLLQRWKKPSRLQAVSLCSQVHARLDYPYRLFFVVLTENKEITNSDVEVATYEHSRTTEVGIGYFRKVDTVMEMDKLGKGDGPIIDMPC